MNLYKIEFFHGSISYVVAKSFAEADRIWHSEPKRHPALSITLIHSKIIIQ